MQRRNRRGFSLVELIVVLVIMAILSAALVPTLIGYIRQSRERNATEQASKCVEAAQTIISSAYADPDGVYRGKLSKKEIDFSNEDDFAIPADTSDFYAEIIILAEVDGIVSNVSIDLNYKINHLEFTTIKNHVTSIYDGKNYTIS